MDEQTERPQDLHEAINAIEALRQQLAAERAEREQLAARIAELEGKRKPRE